MMVIIKAVSVLRVFFILLFNSFLILLYETSYFSLFFFLLILSLISFHMSSVMHFSLLGKFEIIVSAVSKGPATR